MIIVILPSMIAERLPLVPFAIHPSSVFPVHNSSLILSAVMMLDYIGWGDAGKLIHQALEKLFLQGVATYDLARFMDKGKALSTSEFGNELIKVL